MEIVLLVGIIFLMVVLLRMVAGVNSRLDEANERIMGLKSELGKLSVRLTGSIQEQPRRTAEAAPMKAAKPEALPEKPAQPAPKAPEKPQDIPVIRVPEPFIMPAAKTPEIVEEKPRPEPAFYTSVPKEKAPAPEPIPGFFERHPDLERFVGENLMNKIGIGILVLGIGFFVKYAIDQDWINETMRVFIGLLCGGLLVGLAHRMRKNYKAFSSVLTGGGVAVFYISIAFAFHQYHLFSQTTAFLLMVLITAFAVLLSLANNKQELAILSILGGFGTPLMVATGEGNYIVLFTYLLILNIGMLVLAYYRKWNLVNIICYVATVLMYGGWMVSSLQKDDFHFPYTGAMLFATGFYLVFFLMNIVNNLREKKSFRALELSLLLSNTFLYYGAGMYTLNHVQQGEWQGLFTACLAVFNFIFAFSLYRSQRADRVLLYVLIGLVLTFLSLVAPVQLHGNQITLFWSAEAVLLLWLSQKSGIKLMKISSVVVSGLMLISLIMDWSQLYFPFSHPLRPLLNQAFITGIVSIISLILSVRLLKNEEEGAELTEGLPLSIVGGIYKLLFMAMLYTVPLLELVFQLKNSAALGDPDRYALYALYNFLFLNGFILYARKRTAANRTAALLFTLAGILSYLALYQWQFVQLRQDYLEGSTSVAFFLLHYLDTALIALAAWQSLTLIRKDKSIEAGALSAAYWFSAFIFIFMASAELEQSLAVIFYRSADTAAYYLEQIRKIGYPVLWSLCSFALMTIGMRMRIKDLRIISLVLFFITIVKLFTFDIRDVAQIGKVLAFISLGIVLLVVSFMYQKIKQVILSDDTPSEDKPEENAAEALE